MVNISTGEVRRHYLRKGVKNILLKATKLNGNYQALITGFRGWYRYRNRNGKTEMALKPFKGRIYEKQIKSWMDTETRSLYWCNNFFKPKVYRKWIDKKEKDKGLVRKPGDYKTTEYYRLGMDIDLIDAGKVKELDADRSVTVAEDRKWLKKAILFAINWLREHGLKKEIIKPYFSGNGGYVTLDPKIAFVNSKEKRGFFLITAFNNIIKQIQLEFFEQEPEGKKYVQFDALNNRSRAWKTILSIHASKPFVCIPLDPTDINIDLEKAKLPTTQKVIKETRKWIRPLSEKKREAYINNFSDLLNSRVISREEHEKKVKRYGDQLDEELGDFLTPLQTAKLKWVKKQPSKNAKSVKSPKTLNVDFDNYEDLKQQFPPCIKKLLEADVAMTHARGKAFLALALKKAGVERKTAYRIWTRICNGLNQGKNDKTNIFESWYDQKDDEFLGKLPSCTTIQDAGGDYSAGLSMRDLDICEPDRLCEHVDNPYSYMWVKDREMGKLVDKFSSDTIQPIKLGEVVE